jgi:hypothetical protein
MNVQHTPIAMTESRERHNYARVSGRWIVLARGVWLALVVFALVVFFSGLPIYLAQLQTLCTETACEYQQLTYSQAELLKGMGLSLAEYAAITLAFALASAVVCLVVSTLIIWRRPDDRMAFIVALMLVMLCPTMVIATPSDTSPWRVLDQCVTLLFLALFMLVFLLFPDGQFVPRWTRWLLVVLLVMQVPTFFPAVPLLPNVAVSDPSWLLTVSGMATVAGVQLYRYRRVSSPLQRQQTKWVVFGLAVPITVFVLVTVLGLFPVLVERSPLPLLAYNEADFTLSLVLPLSFGFAMLRSRLWEIDSIINRTLVYGTLTVLLTGVYVGLVIGLQALLRGVISQDNGVAIVISTLAIVALFGPLRHRIQQFIDRRFYRRKYDAARVVAAFGSTLRNEVDLPTLSEHLVTVVQETMQPTHVSLWLVQRETRHARKD